MARENIKQALTVWKNPATLLPSALLLLDKVD